MKDSDLAVPAQSEARRRYDKLIAKETRRLSDKLDVSFQSNPFRSLNKRFVIAASPRTGSTLLCERLLAHGAYVTESLQPIKILRTCRSRKDNRLQVYCEKYIKRNTPDGVFGTKGWPSLLATLVLAGEFPTYIHEWKFVYLKRENVLRQAISKVVASRSGTWRAGKEPGAALTDEDFDAEAIAAKVETSVAGNLFWENFFSLFGIEPLRITYEEMAKDPAAIAASVAAYLDLKGEPIQPRRTKPPLQKQATNLNETWERRYQELKGGRAGEGASRQLPSSRSAKSRKKAAPALTGGG